MGGEVWRGGEGREAQKAKKQSTLARFSEIKT